MDFQNHVLTSDGRELLAQAISSNQRIIFVRAMSSATYMDEAALVDLRPEDLTGPMGIIKTTSATGCVARVMTEFTNQPVSAKIKTVAVMARLAAQTDAAAIVMMAQSDPTAGIYIPSTAELNAYIQVSFNLVINATGEVEVTSSSNVSLGDHERLLERTVTTHADGDPTVGDNQTIKGDKIFENDVYVLSDLVASANIRPSTVQCKIGTYERPFQYLYAGGLMAYSPQANRGFVGLAVEDGYSPSQMITFSSNPKSSVSINASNAYINLRSSGSASGCEFDITFAARKQIEITYDSNQSAYIITTNALLNAAGGISGNLNNATGVLASLYSNEIGGLVELTITSRGSGPYTSFTFDFPRGFSVPGGTSGGYVDGEKNVELSVTTDYATNGSMRFNLLRPLTFNFPAHSGWRTGDTLTVLAIRTA